MKTKIYTKGLDINKVENAPGYVLFDIKIKKDELIKWLNERKTTREGDIHLTVKESRGGKIYSELNTYCHQDEKIN